MKDLNDMKVGTLSKPVEEFAFKDSTLSEINSKMSAKGFRHIPVLDGNGLGGMINEKDLNLASSLEWKNDMRASDIMDSDPYIVESDASLTDVLDTFIEKKIDSAMVSFKESNSYGIFTSYDALVTLKGLVSKN